MSAESKDSGASPSAPPAKADVRPASDAVKGADDSPIVQYLVIRKDLVEVEKWPLGALLAQASHAAVAAVWLNREDPATIEYCSGTNLDNMHKVVLELKNEVQLRNFSEKLEAKGVKHKLWMEQPENIPTCLATKPYKKSDIADEFIKCKLCR
ncbi:Peptidyl-tRNA hydrolase II (PTH2) family protein [Klebsormidium nitens]|uniref:peptidyl-tRNA hydrolase n=1 Tax=Klebsormidium nitens TaxID=105231 RepID=A0A1Y1IGL7_KLENI|nr:Peptidyl-tRNA hydrolase II (PTH2) family protein [Klebsormidium nitens]|eukprot:GAQ89202.1 Peptidyl-tRNA hydrolase II (PTH2) family protein [Klebsormidium nitens]